MQNQKQKNSIKQNTNQQKTRKIMLIENQKNYNVHEVESIFFRPTFCGKSASELGIRVIYNMPMPTTVQVFSHNSNILCDFSSGWQGGSAVERLQKSIPMTKVKAESAYSAEEYFSTIFELITNTSDVSLGDLTGTELEKAETELFRRAIADSVFATTWLGDTGGEISNDTTYDGLLYNILSQKNDEGDNMPVEVYEQDPGLSALDLFRFTWGNATDNLRALASEGELAFFVTSDIYDAYQMYLDSTGSAAAYADCVNGRPSLHYHGIPIVEVPTSKYGANKCQSFILLTDRRNFVLALNTADSPEKEIRMWYNPDEMENRQRAVFLAGTTVLDPQLVSGVVSHVIMEAL